MHRKDLLIDDRCDWETVEAIGKRFPQLDVEPTLACGFQIKQKKTNRGWESVLATCLALTLPPPTFQAWQGISTYTHRKTRKFD